jgi:hypothetical protein
LFADAQILTPQPYAGQRNDPYYRDDPYYGDDRDVRRERPRERRRDRDGYGYAGDPLNLANRIMSDVRTVASNNYGIEKHDRKHFEEVEEELGKFTRKYREGKFDKNNLKDAAESLQHLANSDGIRSSRDRRILGDALNAVNGLRSGAYDMNTRSRTSDRGPIW